MFKGPHVSTHLPLPIQPHVAHIAVDRLKVHVNILLQERNRLAHLSIVNFASEGNFAFLFFNFAQEEPSVVYFPLLCISRFQLLLFMLCPRACAFLIFPGLIKSFALVWLVALFVLKEPILLVLPQFWLAKLLSKICYEHIFPCACCNLFYRHGK